MSFCPKDQIDGYRKQVNGNPYECSSRIQFDFLHHHIRSCTEISQAVKDKQTTERTALQLCAFLAHWGMFRGKGKLGDRNLYFFQEICLDLLGNKGVLSRIEGIPFENLHRKLKDSVLQEAIDGVKCAFELRGVSPTDTLVSKTMLGLLGNIPGYDRYFKKGLSKLKENDEFKGTMGFGVKGLLNLSEWCTEYDWPSIKSKADKRRLLPRGRLVDMAIHQYGRPN